MQGRAEQRGSKLPLTGHCCQNFKSHISDTGTCLGVLSKGLIKL